MGGVLDFVGEILGMDSDKKQADASQASADAQRRAVELDAQRFGWTKEQAEAELQRRLRSAKNFYADMPEQVTYEQAQTMAENQLNPLYEEQMEDTLDDVNRGLMARGFFGQAPGAALAQEAASKVAKAKVGAIGNLANELYQTGQDRNLAYKSLGIGSFGTYGDVTPNQASTENAASNVIPNQAPVYNSTTSDIKVGVPKTSSWVGSRY